MLLAELEPDIFQVDGFSIATRLSLEGNCLVIIAVDSDEMIEVHDDDRAWATRIRTARERRERREADLAARARRTQ